MVYLKRKINLPAFTIGIEEEFQVIDPHTRELRSHMHQIVEGGKVVLKEQVKAEMHQSVVEVGTNICKDVKEARKEVTYLRQMVAKLAHKQGLVIAAAGTHPFSRWQDQLITDHPRYEEIIREMQDAARSNLIFGLHVHVGIEDRETGIRLMNQARYFLPHIFALSTNSPFWEGRNTGFKSFRTKVFDKFPRTGIPDEFYSATQYDDYIKLLIKTKCIDNAKKVWWDIRLHPFFNTIEFRICDIPMRIEETITLAAIMQAIIAKLYWLMQYNLSFRTYSRALINENKWRAARYGIENKLIDFGKEKEVETTQLIEELVEFIDDLVDDLGSRKEVDHVFDMMKKGTGADRQLDVYAKTGDLKKVVDYIINETNIGISVKKDKNKA
ncbi:MAG TPA: carboxylate-amine ligase [Bacteroidia bacterium]|nr:MAG: carboxylate-amine ligase ybdK [Bacteroidetes bacterium OLB10]MBV6453763.1 putative glutamate--cysteine ligase 2 [Bacteroidia bacterium]MBX3106720.1 carboxylate-amine ligase [Bacteroidota bacterium]MCB8930357.1 carboxylate-amine ligase [Bacteroidia bacterium]MCO5289769.1 carboxylate-amine ligase [Bacteroidota bacterium]